MQNDYPCPLHNVILPYRLNYCKNLSLAVCTEVNISKEDWGGAIFNVDVEYLWQNKQWNQFFQCFPLFENDSSTCKIPAGSTKETRITGLT